MAIREQLRQQLLDGLRQMQLEASAAQVDQLLDYLALFEKWNRAYNLSAVRDAGQMVDRHLLDSLSVAPYIDAAQLVDVGSGGGLPGIPLAILLPQKSFTLLDSNGKKTRFLFQVVSELGLRNVRVEQSRAEDFHPAHRYDAVISRAFASLRDMTECCSHLLQPGGVYYAMKGVYPQDELSMLQKHYKVSAVHSLEVPREQGQRHLLVLTG